MEHLIIEGGKKLKGSLKIKGAKNSVLPIMAASLLNGSGKDVVLENIPDLVDMHIMREILQSLGINVHYVNGNLRIGSGNFKNYAIPDQLMREMRSSIFLMGPLLAKLGKVKISYPGGCSIGHRPIDLHLKGLESMGAKFWEEKGFIFASATQLKGAEIHLDYPSVGATENLMMAAALAKGKTIIHNAAKEPEIVDLQNFLNAMGAAVRGAGTDTLKIEGVKRLENCTYRVIPDRIVAGTYMIAAAITGGEVILTEVIPAHLEGVIAKLREAGIIVESTEDTVKIASGNLKAVETLRTFPYPGFPTDLQSQMMVLLSLARGESMIVESVFEARFKHVVELKKMNASIMVEGCRAHIKGIEKLRGAEVETTDLRAGAALVLAGLAAEGTTIVSGVKHIDRGYERIEKELRLLGANIIRGSKENLIYLS